MVEVILVNEQNKELGSLERLVAHQNPGKLHRAVSVVLIRRVKNQVEVLLQQRSKDKPLWPLYWANTVCTHPWPKESIIDCAVRRLKEEMGIEVEKIKLHELFSFMYQADYNTELSEHEYDTVVMGEWDGEMRLNPSEVAEAKWVNLNQLKQDIKNNPNTYAPWPKLIINDKRFENYIWNQQ